MVRNLYFEYFIFWLLLIAMVILVFTDSDWSTNPLYYDGTTRPDEFFENSRTFYRNSRTAVTIPRMLDDDLINLEYSFKKCRNIFLETLKNRARERKKKLSSYFNKKGRNIQE